LTTVWGRACEVESRVERRVVVSVIVRCILDVELLLETRFLVVKKFKVKNYCVNCLGCMSDIEVDGVKYA
jgi:hypothetical protein